jgi:hypothetical protein
MPAVRLFADHSAFVPRRADQAPRKQRRYFKSTRQLADELLDSGALPADEFIEMDCSDPEWFVHFYVRKTVLGRAFKKLIGIA